MQSFTGLVVLLVASIAVTSARAVSIPECPANLTRFTEPLAYTNPDLYTAHFYLVVHSKTGPHLAAGVTTMVRFNQKPDANVIVLNVDKSVDIYTAVAPTLQTKIVCRNSGSDALVIETWREIAANDLVEIAISSGAPVRLDNRGIYKTRNGVYKASFAQSEARLILPCFDGPAFKSVVATKLDIDLDYDAVSKLPKIERVVVNEKDKIKTVIFDDTQKINLKDYAFEIHPARQTSFGGRH